MEIELAKRLNKFKTGIFTEINEKQIEITKTGKKLYNLFVGTPDFMPYEGIRNAFVEAGKDPKNYKYTLRDSDEMLEAVVKYYKKRFTVDISKDEIVAVEGTQEGMSHLGMVLADPGDTVLLPNPGYPAFEAGTAIAGANEVFYPLLAKNNFMPDFDGIDPDTAKKAKYMVISYPYNPVCRAASDEIYKKAIEFAKKYNIIIIHDNAYSDIIFDGRKGKSFLSFDGAKEVGAEFFSLSKSFNVTGLRISFLIGNKKIIDGLKLLRSQYNFGMSAPTQKAAVAALESPYELVAKQCMEYQKRRDALCGGLRSIGWDVPDSEGTMFVWAPIPKGFKTSREFALKLIEKAGVVCTPGDAFGSLGEGYVRFALVMPPEKLKEAVKAVEESGLIK